MFRISDHQLARNCQGFSRRDFLKVGSLGVGGLSLPQLLAAKDMGLPVTGKSVVLLFLQGGAPHIELFDPKMTAPSEYRSVTGEVPTALPGVTFGGTFPKMAKMADRMAVVRSFGSKNGGHTYESVTTGRNDLKATMGAIYSRIVGTNHAGTGMPTNVLVRPEAIEKGLKLGSNFETKALPTLTQTGSLGSGVSAFDPAGSGDVQQDMEMRIEPDRLTDRKGLLSRLDVIRKEVDASGNMDSVDRFQQQAFDIISKGIGNAFDLTKEDPRTLSMYDTRSIFDAKKLQKWGDMRRVSNHLGHQLLMARRLCEAGCGFVTVSDCGWDYHANNNSPKNMTGIYPMGRQVDHAVSAFLQDVQERGLSEDILLIVTSEMGVP